MRNAFGLYVLQIGSYLVPVVTLVFVARLLGPSNWGDLAFIQAFASCGMLVVNYGFGYSATRDVARNRNDREALGRILAAVLSAKVALATLAVAVMVGLSFVIGTVHSSVQLLAPAILWAFGFSFSLGWFYQGLEQMAFVARWETIARVLSLAGLLAFVRSADDAWKVLVVQGVTQWAAIAVELIATYRRIPVRRPTAQLTMQALQRGWPMFLFTGALSFYTVGNAFILGLLANPTAVGYYAGAERISRAFATMLYPVSQAIFPRISHLAHSARAEAARLVRTSLVVLESAGVAMAIVIFATAPALVRVLLGPGFEGAVPVLRILALLPPLIAMSNVLGIQWSLALDLERLVTALIASASALNVCLAFVLVPRYAHVGMALAVVASEGLVAIGLLAALRYRRLDPFAVRTAPRAEAAQAVEA